MSVLVVAELAKGALAHSTRSVISAANQIGGDVHVLVAGSGVDGAVASGLVGVSKVLLADDAAYANFLAENMASLVVSLADGYSHILAPATTFGKDFMPRAAVLLDSAQISDIVEVKSADTFVRPIYAGNALATVQSSESLKFITVRPSAFDAVGDGGSSAVETVASTPDSGLSTFVSEELTVSARPELGGARVVVSGGRGVGSAEDFAIIEALADKLEGAVGASRAAVDAGYVSNDMQVGQTGKIVAPDLYIAVGISGAIQHLAGMKNSKIIVAINKDENAPIFEVADYGLVSDLFDAVPEMTSKL
jgi:electron transfer flavoprotein alpha subunit